MTIRRCTRTHLLATALFGWLLAVGCAEEPSIPVEDRAAGGQAVGSGGDVGAPISLGASGMAGGGMRASTGGGGANQGGAAFGGASGVSGGGAATSGGAAAAGGVSGGGAGGAVGAGSAGAGSSCAVKRYALCEDFESGILGGVPDGWAALPGYASSEGVGIANDQARTGSMSLKSNSATPGQARMRKSLTALGATASVHFGRIFFKVQTPAPRRNDGVIHLTLAVLEGRTENRILDTVEASNGSHQFLFNLPDDSCCTKSPYDYEYENSWRCAEWHVSVPERSFQFWIDGAEVRSLAFSGRADAKMSSYTSIAIGAIFYQTPPAPFVVWFDDLALDDTRVGCD